ncbi:MAG: cell division cycle protein 20-like protein [Amphiamblys sp. WSBS2006]|nr:MAG: cell division cycle protein 20-like protein [Amphiamblys sp. WSBS2006]
MRKLDCATDRFISKPQTEKKQNKTIYSSLLYKTLHGKTAEEDRKQARRIQEIKHKNKRRAEISQYPIRILDGPGLVDDFYVNILEWMPQRDVMAIALGFTIYLWDELAETSSELFTAPESKISSINFIDETRILVSHGAQTEIFNIPEEKHEKIFSFGTGRVLVSSRPGIIDEVPHFVLGTENGYLHFQDRRTAEPTLSLHAHDSEICAAKWAPHGTYLATGSNDKTAKIWDLRMGRFPTVSFADHAAAVRALDWCPARRNTIATGGGLHDKKIIVWSTVEGAVYEKTQADTQVAKLQWVPHRPTEFVTTHGGETSQTSHPVVLWKTNDLAEIARLGDHDRRVLQMGISPRLNVLSTASPNGTIKFWKIV